jgi:hypothetical protein
VSERPERVDPFRNTPIHARCTTLPVAPLPFRLSQIDCGIAELGMSETTAIPTGDQRALPGREISVGLEETVRQYLNAQIRKRQSAWVMNWAR